jgi:hypothetical protein
MLYYLRSDGAYCTNTGMTQDQITSMLIVQGLTCSFIDQVTYAGHLVLN